MTVALAVSGSNLAGTTPYSCALRIGGRVVAAQCTTALRSDLAVLVANLCREQSIDPRAITELRADLGPGSYTGLRIALTFARTLASFANCRAVAADSLMLLAAAVPQQRAPLRVVVDARAGRWLTARLQWQQDDRLVPQHDSKACAPADWLAQVTPDELILTPPNMLPLAQAALASHGLSNALLGVAPLSAAALFDERLPVWPITPDQLAPRYLMGSYAEPKNENSPPTA